MKTKFRGGEVSQLRGGQQVGGGLGKDESKWSKNLVEKNKDISYSREVDRCNSQKMIDHHKRSWYL